MDGAEPLGTVERRGIGGGSISGLGTPAFSLDIAAAPPLPVLIAAPHGGRSYPPDVVAAMRDPAATAHRLEDRAIDRIATQVARATGAALLVAHAPRAMIDLNRAPEDMDWTMLRAPSFGHAANRLPNRRARGGLGLVPRRMAGVGEIWKTPLSPKMLEQRLASIHRPYHAALAGALDRLRDRWGAALLIDLHSMPPLDANGGAGFVVGDRFGAACGSTLGALALRSLGSTPGSPGRGVAHNRPYAGGYVLDRHGRPEAGVHAMQLEVCRSLYLDDAMRSLAPTADALTDTLAAFVRTMAREVAIDGARDLPVAAE